VVPLMPHHDMITGISSLTDTLLHALGPMVRYSFPMLQRYQIAIAQVCFADLGIIELYQAATKSEANGNEPVFGSTAWDLRSIEGLAGLYGWGVYPRSIITRS
jgi:hypothetical protein